MPPDCTPPVRTSRLARTPLWSLSVSSAVREFLDRPRAGTILAAFHRSCYIDLDGHVIALVAPALLNGPLNIVVDLPEDESFLALRVETNVTSDPTTVWLEDGPAILLSSAAVWNSTLTPWQQPLDATLWKNLELAHAMLIREALAESFAHYLPGRGGQGRLEADSDSPPARRAMESLAAGIRGFQLGSIREAARTLAGLGLGLTPSGDDVLVGVLLALTVWSASPAGLMREAIAAAARGRGTRISEAYREAAARGEASEAWHRLLAILPRATPTSVAPAVRRVMAFGETSGADMLAGFVLASAAWRS